MSMTGMITIVPLTTRASTTTIKQKRRTVPRITIDQMRKHHNLLSNKKRSQNQGKLEKYRYIVVVMVMVMVMTTTTTTTCTIIMIIKRKRTLQSLQYSTGTNKDTNNKREKIKNSSFIF